MASELFARLTDLVERGDTAGCLAAAGDASNAKDLEDDSDEILALVVHSDLPLDDDFDRLLSVVSAAGSAKTNLLSLLGGFSSSSGAPRVTRLFPSVASTLARVPAGRPRDKLAAFALSKAVTFLRRLAEREQEEEAVMDFVSDMEAALISPLAALTDSTRPLVNALTHVFRLALAPCNMRRDRETGSAPRALALAERYLERIRASHADPVRLLAGATGEVEDEEDEDEAVLKRPSRCGVGVMLYAIYAESAAPDAVPSCYDPLFVYVESMGCMTALCEAAAAADPALLRKGLLLSAALLARIPAADSVGHDVVDSERFGGFLAALVRAVTYCDAEELRRLGFETVSGIHSRLRFDAEFKFFFSVTESKCHSGLKGWAVSKMKDLALRTDAGDDPGRKAALFGPRFKQLCLRTFRLERGAETDLLEVSDEVMAALSFLFCIRSRGTPDAEEILAELRPTFLAELERGLGTARAHYQAQLQTESAVEADSAGEVSVTVAGQRLPQMGREETRDFAAAALNTLDLMEMSLARLNSLM